MGNAALAWNNLIDLSTTVITATAENPSTPANDYLRSGQYEHPLWRWLTSVSSASLIVDFASSVDIDTLALIAPLGSNPTVRFRLSDTDATGQAGEIYDSGSLTDQFDSNYLPLVHLISSVKTGRYLRIDQSNVTEVGAGRLFAGARDEFSINFSPGWSRTPIRRSLDVAGAGGQTFVDRKRGTWSVDATFDFMSETDRNGFVETVDITIVNDGHLDMLWIRDVDSTNLSRDCIWGYVDGDAPVTEPVVLNPTAYQKTYRIRQRL